MKLDEILFSVNEYHGPGYILETGIFLHFGETRVKVADNLEDFKDVTKRINGMVKEIEENY